MQSNKSTRKKILFVRPRRNVKAPIPEEHLIQTHLERDFDDQAEMTIGYFHNFIFEVDGNTQKISHYKEGYDIADFDLVIIRLVGEKIETGITIAHYLEARGTPFIDSYLLYTGVGKLTAAFIQSIAGLPGPKTLHTSTHVLHHLIDHEQMPTWFSFPCVVKDNHGRKGHNNFLVEDPKELFNILEQENTTEFILQKYIPNSGDLRVLVFNGTVGPVIKRKAGPDQYLNNTSAGASAELIPLEEVGQDVLDMAVRSAKALKLEVCGVDIIEHKVTGEKMILESNIAPQIGTGSFPDIKLSSYTKAIMAILAINK